MTFKANVFRADPLSNFSQVVSPEGVPTDFFIQQWNALTDFVFTSTGNAKSLKEDVEALEATEIVAGVGLTGGGVLAAGTITIDMADTAVTPGTYGDASNGVEVTVDQQGRITGIVQVPLVVSASVAVEDNGSALGNFTTFNFTNFTLSDAGGGQVDITAPTGITGVDVEDNGTPEGTFTVFNFTNFTIADVGSGQVDITIPTPTVAVEDNGTPVAAFSTFNFTNFTIADAGGGQVDITAPTGISGVDVEDNGTPEGTFTTFNFTNFTITDAGGGQVDITAPSGGSVDVEENNVSVTSPASVLNFTGSVSVTDAGSGQADINIPGGIDPHRAGRMFKNANQFVGAGSFITIAYDVTEGDAVAAFNVARNRFTVPAALAGRDIYLFATSHSTFNLAGFLSLEIWINNTTLLARDASDNPGDGALMAGLMIHNAVVGDYYEIKMFNSNNNTLRGDIPLNTFNYFVLGRGDMSYTINDQTGTTYTLAIGDAEDYVRCTNAAAITLTVPPNSSTAFPIGTEVLIEQGGAGTVTVSPGSGVTINSRGSLDDLNGQYAVARLVKVAVDTWTLTGDLV